MRKVLFGQKILIRYEMGLAKKMGLPEEAACPLHERYQEYLQGLKTPEMQALVQKRVEVDWNSPENERRHREVSDHIQKIEDAHKKPSTSNIRY